MSNGWRPKIGERMYWIAFDWFDGDNTDISSIGIDSCIHEEDFEEDDFKFNCFRTRKEAQQALKKIRGILR